MEKKNEEEKEEFLPGFKTVQEFSADGFKRVINGVKAFQALPQHTGVFARVYGGSLYTTAINPCKNPSVAQPGPSWDLHKSYPEFSRGMKHARSKIVPMMASLLKHVNIPTSDFRSRDVDEKFEFLVECNDDMLERIGSSLDEAEGLFTKSEMVVMDKGLAVTSLKAPGTWGKRKLNEEEELGESKSKAQEISNRQMKKATYRLRVTEKPQLKFSVPIDNSTAPFVPKLKEKPNSIKPLSILPEYTSKNEEFFGHPYLVELNRWEPRDDILTKVNPQVPKVLKDTPLVFVNNARDLERMMYDLLDKKVIAVDLEHHSYRTYLGLTCLIQLSSKEKDYVIDGLALRDDLYHLNEILTDPKVLKVFHGSTNDIDWLQRDFGLYVVSMFDTYVAAKVLGLPQCSLQYLLGKYCSITQNKSLQLADWRIRPLPNDMLEYARQDTHYLIYIYECMRNELIDAGNRQNNLLMSVYDQSKLMCLKRYEKPVSNAQLALRKARRTLNNRQLYAFTEIYKWRDEIAREKDESLGFVLPNHMLLTIAETLPKEMNGILACCDPVPPLLTSNLGKIHKIITNARELPLHQQSVQKDKVSKKVKLKNWVVAVNSIHDIDTGDMLESSKGNNYDSEEVVTTKPEDNTTWPQSWVDPGGWNSLTRDKPSSWNFGRRITKKAQSSSCSQNISAVGLDPESLNTPFGRYEASKKILDFLKDPQKEENLDLTDPLVKAVYEAVTVVDEAEKISEEVQEVPAQQLSKVLDEGEFIPFNPLAEPRTKRKRRGKKGKREPWDGLRSEENEEDDQREDVFGVENEDESGDDSSQPANVDSPIKSSPLMNASKEKRNKKKKGKLLNRLKNVFSKNKPRNKSEDNTDVIDVDDNDEQADAPEPSTKKPKSFESHNQDSEHRPSPPRKRARGGAHPGHRQPTLQQNSSPSENNRHQNARRGGRHKNKAGIFNAFKRGNKSVTFK